MESRRLPVTANTTLDYVEASADGPGVAEDAVAVVDVEVPESAAHVALGLELDPADLEALAHHVDRVPLSPERARDLAADLVEAADAAERDEPMRTGRGR